jgi:hypothetical protein
MGKDQPKFGDVVSIKEKYKRVWGQRQSNYGGTPHNAHTKEWKRVPFVHDSCLFLGYRMISNGWNEYEYEVGYVFAAIESFKAALVCPGPNKNPVYVPLDALTKEV